MTDVRSIVYETLLLAEDNRTGSVTKDVLNKYSYLPEEDRRFIKRLTEGVTERRITLDHIADIFSKTPSAKMKKQIRTLIRMGTYQLIYMDSVADHAAVNETVKLARKRGFSQLSGFVNGVLRNIAANREKITWPDRDRDPVRFLSVTYSCPEWIVSKLIDEEGIENAETLLKLSVSTRPVTARVNLSKGTPGDVTGEGYCDASDVLPFAVTLRDYDKVMDIPAFCDGRICIQDISSMMVGLVAHVTDNDTVLDMCASPGGKSLHLADLAQGATVISCDVSDKKIEKIEENIKRCGFSNITTMVADATVFDPKFEGRFDMVIADVPCSGLGVMGRKNDIRYNLTPESIDSLTKLQKKILLNAVRYLKPGATLMFSTCTCSKGENIDNFEFLRDECNLTPVSFFEDLPEALRCDTAKDGYLQLYGKDLLTDGFFIGKFRK